MRLDAAIKYPLEKKDAYFRRERVLLLKLHLSSYVFLVLVLRWLSILAFIDHKPGAVSRGGSRWTI